MTTTTPEGATPEGLITPSKEYEHILVQMNNHPMAYTFKLTREQQDAVLAQLARHETVVIEATPGEGEFNIPSANVLFIKRITDLENQGMVDAMNRMRAMQMGAQLRT